jgi:hypothetical protein
MYFGREHLLSVIRRTYEEAFQKNEKLTFLGIPCLEMPHALAHIS